MQQFIEDYYSSNVPSDKPEVIANRTLLEADSPQENVATSTQVQQ